MSRRGAATERAAEGLTSNAPLWSGWRRRALVVAVSLACLALLVLTLGVAATPTLPGRWVATDEGELSLLSSPLPALAAVQGQVLLAVNGTAVDAAVLHRSPRWQPQDRARQAAVAQQVALSRSLGKGSLTLQFEGAAGPNAARPDARQSIEAVPQQRGVTGLGWAYWPLAALALVLYGLGWVVWLARPQARSALFLLMALCQSGHLLSMAVATVPGLGPGLPPALWPLIALDMPLRLWLDLATGAAVVHTFAIHPHRLPKARVIAIAAWATVPLGVLAVGWAGLPHAWWWAQALCLALGTAALAVVTLSYRQEPNPYALAMRRFNVAALTTLLLVTLGIAAASSAPAVAHGVAVGASVVWSLFLASLLLLAPFLAGRQAVLREFALLAGISTVAASLDLLFVAAFSLGPFASLAIAVFLAFALYAGARQYLLTRLLGTHQLSIERTFELLYRAARAVQLQPAQYPQHLTQLLRDLFEPLEVLPGHRVPLQAQVVAGGSSLLVPVASDAALTLRFAQRGQRLFTHEDGRLADRVVEQLRRARAYDQAVERGRAEERQRIAQDLHDDIGARLLTLMYQAPTPDIEDYIRHTLQDLKTLTRGLAAAEHHLADAAAEWKADLGQRLSAARAQLVWSFNADSDPLLTVVQWSALTRVIRELVSNALYHGAATRIEVTLKLQAQALTLQVLDDGQGTAPQSWAHGLGLGGVRKRVKLLAGEVVWAENAGGGISCTVTLPAFLTAP